MTATLHQLRDGASAPGDEELVEFHVRVLDETSTGWLCEDTATRRQFWLRKATCEVEGNIALVPRWIARNARWTT